LHCDISRRPFVVEVGHYAGVQVDLGAHADGCGLLDPAEHSRPAAAAWTLLVLPEYHSQSAVRVVAGTVYRDCHATGYMNDHETVVVILVSLALMVFLTLVVTTSPMAMSRGERQLLRRLPSSPSLPYRNEYALKIVGSIQAEMEDMLGCKMPLEEIVLYAMS
jgi:hypothetical protein